MSRTPQTPFDLELRAALDQLVPEVHTGGKWRRVEAKLKHKRRQSRIVQAVAVTAVVVLLVAFGTWAADFFTEPDLIVIDDRDTDEVGGPGSTEPMSPSLRLEAGTPGDLDLFQGWSHLADNLGIANDDAYIVDAWADLNPDSSLRSITLMAKIADGRLLALGWGGGSEAAIALTGSVSDEEAGAQSPSMMSVGEFLAAVDRLSRSSIWAGLPRTEGASFFRVTPSARDSQPSRPAVSGAFRWNGDEVEALGESAGDWETRSGTALVVEPTVQSGDHEMTETGEGNVPTGTWEGLEPFLLLITDIEQPQADPFGPGPGNTGDRPGYLTAWPDLSLEELRQRVLDQVEAPVDQDTGRSYVYLPSELPEDFLPAGAWGEKLGGFHNPAVDGAFYGAAFSNDETAIRLVVNPDLASPSFTLGALASPDVRDNQELWKATGASVMGREASELVQHGIVYFRLELPQSTVYVYGLEEIRPQIWELAAALAPVAVDPPA